MFVAHIDVIIVNMGFENQIINSIDRRNPGEHPVIVEMHKPALKVLHEDQIKSDRFSGHFGKEAIEKDKKTIIFLKSKFEPDPTKKVADILEAIIYQQANLSGWLGPNVETIKTSEYDDIVNKVDLIAEFNSEYSPSHLAFGVDVTFGSKTLWDKVNKIKEELEADKLAEIKYFESHGFIGSLKQVPRVIVGVEKDTVIELAGLWMRKSGEKIGAHHARDILGTQIIEQLRVYKNYAERHNKPNALRSYNQALGILKPLQEQLKKLDRAGRELISKDRVYQSINEELKFKFSK